MTNSPASILILGGNSLIAPWLLRRLVASGRTGLVVSRRPCNILPGFEARELDIRNPGGWQPDENSIVISLVPLWTLADALPFFQRCQRIIALGSTSSLGKRKSRSLKDRMLAQDLQNAEARLLQWSAERKIPFTLLRTTLIYDGVRDRNVTRLARFMQRFGFVPVAAPANGLRQPIHADDVADAIYAALQAQIAPDRPLNIAGGEILTYRAMLERIAEYLPRRVKIVPLPLWLLRGMFKLASLLRLVRETSFDGEMFTRMNRDLIYDIKPAAALLQLKPRKFVPDPARN